MSQPLISVIVPAYNSEKTIAVAIDSILHQTYRNLEIIVVDDKSTDRTKNIVEEIIKKDARVRLVDGHDDLHRFDVHLGRNINAGYSARNTGFEHVQGELITFQDSDDVSLLNRIEIQYDLLTKNKAEHVTLDWFQFDEKHIGKSFDLTSYTHDLDTIPSVGPEELYILSQKSKGLVAKISRKINASIPFHFKRIRVMHRLFFGSLASYPGTGNSPLFTRAVIEKVKFRKLSDRIWPTFMGRGADRDFNFQVAETFKNSYVFFLPLYMWRQNRQNERYSDGLEKYLID